MKRLLYLGMFTFVFWVGLPLQAQSQDGGDTDNDGIPDDNEKAACIQDVKKIFSRNTQVYLRFTNKTRQGRIKNVLLESLASQNEFEKKKGIRTNIRQIEKALDSMKRIDTRDLSVVKNKALQENINRLERGKVLLEDSLRLPMVSREEEKTSYVYVFKFNVQPEDTQAAEIRLSQDEFSSLFNPEGCLKDQDGDGRADVFDQCPQEHGLSKLGCPEVKIVAKVDSNASQNQDSGLVPTRKLPAKGKKKLQEVLKEIERDSSIQDSIVSFISFFKNIEDLRVLPEEDVLRLKGYANFFKDKTEEYTQLNSEVVNYLNELVAVKELSEELLTRLDLYKQRENTIAVVSALAIFVLICFISVLLFQYNRIKKKNADLKLKGEALEKSNEELTKNQADLRMSHAKIKEKRTALEKSYAELAEKQKELEHSNVELGKKNNMIELLLRELNHRVRNNLLAISSLMYNELTSDNTDDMDVKIENVTARIAETEKLHSKLTYKEDTKDEVDLPEYFDEIIDSLCKLYGHQLMAKPQISINGKIDGHAKKGKAYFLGFIVYELANNSMKYAFRQTSQPNIQIDFTIEEGRLFQMHYQDNGLGITDELLQDGKFQYDLITSNGLKIINLIAEMHEGVFTVLPESSRKLSPQGAQFTCQLTL